jgi:YVTN family beta-propeller protein
VTVGDVDDPRLRGHVGPLDLGDDATGSVHDSDYSDPAETVTATILIGGRARDLVVSPDSEYLYVAQRDSVTVIGSGRHIVARVPFTGDPKDIAIDASGTRLFVFSYGGSVSVINTRDQSVRTISGGWNSDVVVSPDGVYIYAADNAIAGRDSVISVINTRGTTVATVPVVNDVIALAVSPDGTRLYAVSSDRRSYYQYPAGWLTIIDTASNAIITRMAVGACPDTMTASADGARLYITHYETCSVSAVDLTTNTVTEIALGDAPLGVTVTPDGAQAYVTGLRSLTVIDTVTLAAADIVTGRIPRGLQISPDGKRAYISDFGDHTVTVLDTITNSVTSTVAVSGDPEAMAVSPDNQRLYVGDYWSGAVTIISMPSVRDEHPRERAGS